MMASEMVEALRLGETVGALARRYEVSAERARLILVGMGVFCERCGIRLDTDRGTVLELCGLCECELRAGVRYARGELDEARIRELLAQIGGS